ncbi:MAG: hypothetical protein KatS3mg108_2047 [Isosphaeraceae bacterium]|nr:MAG: hypothetical protein KatS3mg108_2047 [Isosphaeraceae bacterium]
MKRLRVLATAAAVATAVWLPNVASAYPSSYDFRYGNVTGNNPTNAATGAQYSFSLINVNATTVGFKFENAGPLASSITDIYFQVGPSAGGLLTGIVSIIDSGAGVDFSAGASPPNLPGGGGANPDFVVTAGLSADSNPPAQPNGVNPGEWVQVNFSIRSGATFSDIQAAVDRAYNNPGAIWNSDGSFITGADEGIRVGIHVQGFSNGGSESFVAQAPEPSSLAIAGLGALGILVYTRRRRR